mgnify:FL=1
MLNKLSSRHAKLVLLKLQENFIGSIITKLKDIFSALTYGISCHLIAVLVHDYQIVQGIQGSHKPYLAT